MRLGAYINPGGDLPAAVSLARLAEQLDYESVWVTHGLGRDSFRHPMQWDNTPNGGFTTGAGKGAYSRVAGCFCPS